MSAALDARRRWRANVPESLRPLPIWLVWKRRKKPDKPGKFDKVPYYTGGRIRHGVNGNVRDRAQLATFDAALAAVRANREYAGIGLALLDDVETWALDLDHCIDASGKLSPLAERVVAASGTYVERSPSGTGVRALFAGKAGIDKKNHIVGVEVFNSRGFVTITGDAIGRGRTITECPPALLAGILEAVGHDKRAARDPGAPRIGAPPENPALANAVKLPLGLWRRIFDPYPPGCDRSAVAFGIAAQLDRTGLTREQALEVMASTEVFAPALERRQGDIESARAWLWRYVVLPAYQTRGVIDGRKK